MKAFLSSLDMSFSMFSIIPMPRVEWKSENMKYALLCLPVIGLVIGLLLWGWGALCLHFSFGPLVKGAGFTLIPVLISGGIHVDGFLDTVDALSSHGDTEKKRAILKDSHAGAFAIIYACVYFLAFFAISAELPICGWFVFLPGLVQMFSRCIAVLASIIYPSAAKQGMLYAFTDPLARTSLVVSIIETVVTAALMILCCWQCGIAMVVLGLLCIPLIGLISRKHFGGMNGDLAGFINTLSQVIMLLGFYLVYVIALA